MKEILSAEIINPYQSHVPAGFYDARKGHCGVDMAYKYELIPAPLDLMVLKLAKQPEMGNVLYCQDAKGGIHVFAHLLEFRVEEKQNIKKGYALALSGNSGSRTTGPHLHYEVLQKSGTNPTMEREGLFYKGDNVDPIAYLKEFQNIDDKVPSEWAKEAWERAKTLKIVSSKTMPRKMVTAEELMIFFDRLGFLDLP